MTSRVAADRPPIVNPQGTDKEMLDSLLASTFLYFRNEVNPRTGLTADKNPTSLPREHSRRWSGSLRSDRRRRTRFTFPGRRGRKNSEGPKVPAVESAGTRSERLRL